MTTTTTATADDATTGSACEACEDGTRTVYPSMFSTDVDDINAQYMDDKWAKQYFDYPFDACPVCGRTYGGQA